MTPYIVKPNPLTIGKKGIMVLLKSMQRVEGSFSEPIDTIYSWAH